MTPKQYEELKNKINEAVPEIMELDCGTYIYQDWGDKKGKIKLLEKPSKEGYAMWKNGTVNINEKGTKILGRPIQLADVLRAIGEKIDTNDYTIKIFHEILVLRDYRQPEKRPFCMNWNLAADLDHQLEEVINFLYQILCPKK